MPLCARATRGRRALGLQGAAVGAPRVRVLGALACRPAMAPPPPSDAEKTRARGGCGHKLDGAELRRRRVTAPTGATERQHASIRSKAAVDGGGRWRRWPVAYALRGQSPMRRLPFFGVTISQWTLWMGATGQRRWAEGEEGERKAFSVLPVRCPVAAHVF